MYKDVIPISTVYTDERDRSHTQVKITNFKNNMKRPELRMTLLSLTILRVGLFCSYIWWPSWPSWSFSISPTQASWGWWGWRHYHFQRPGPSSGWVNIFNWLLIVLWGTLTLQSSTEPSWYLFWHFLLHPSLAQKVYKKYLHVNGCQSNSFWLRIVIFLHKQNKTMFHLWLKQTCIFYREKIIVFFKLVTFIRVYCVLTQHFCDWFGIVNKRKENLTFSGTHSTSPYSNPLY